MPGFEELSPIIRNNRKYQNFHRRGKVSFWRTVQREVYECAKKFRDMDPGVTLERLLDADWTSFEDPWDFLRSYDVEVATPVLHACISEKIAQEEAELRAEEQENEELKERKLELAKKLLIEWKKAEEDGFLEMIEDTARHLISEYPEEVREIYEEEQTQKSSGYEGDYNIEEGKLGFPAIEFYDKYSSSILTFMELRRALNELKRTGGASYQVMKVLKEIRKEIEKLKEEIEKKEVIGTVSGVGPGAKGGLEGMIEAMSSSYLQSTMGEMEIECREYDGILMCLDVEKIREVLNEWPEIIRKMTEAPDEVRYVDVSDVIKKKWFNIYFIGKVVDVVADTHTGDIEVITADGKKYPLRLEYVEGLPNICLYDPELMVPYVYVGETTLRTLASTVAPGHPGWLNYIKACMYHSIGDPKIEDIVRRIHHLREPADIVTLDVIVHRELKDYLDEHTPSEIRWLRQFYQEYTKELKKCKSFVGVPHVP